jgi:hypothetical protein
LKDKAGAKRKGRRDLIQNAQNIYLINFKRFSSIGETLPNHCFSKNPLGFIVLLPMAIVIVSSYFSSKYLINKEEKVVKTPRPKIPV